MTRYTTEKMVNDLESWFEYGIETDIYLRDDREEYAPFVNQVRGVAENKDIPIIVLYLLKKELRDHGNSIFSKIKNKLFKQKPTNEKKIL